MPFKERVEIIKALSFVDEVFESIDEDSTVCKVSAAVKRIFLQGWR